MAARITKLPARRTQNKSNRQHWGQRLDKFRLRFQLSERDLCAVVDYAVKKSAMHNLLAGNCQLRMERIVKPVIATNLRRYLREVKRLSKIAVERELIEIFHEPVCTKPEEETVITQRTALSKPAQQFFSLSQDPFDPKYPGDIAQVFSTPGYNDCLAHILDSIKFQGFNAVIGEVGSGKTILRRRAEYVCTESGGRFELLWPEFYNMDKVHSGSIASFVLEHFEVEVPRDLLRRARRLKRLLVTLADKKVSVALGFDECHRLDPRLLTALKNFWEMGDGGFDRYLGLLLLGQPQFQTTLEATGFREISERLNIVRIPGLGKNATAYIAHRLSFAGGKLERLFQPAAVSRILKLADTPLAVGNVANAALMRAYGKGVKSVVPEFIPNPPGADPKARSVRESQ